MQSNAGKFPDAPPNKALQPTPKSGAAELGVSRPKGVRNFKEVEMLEIFALLVILIPMIAICIRSGINMAYALLGFLTLIGLVIFGLRLSFGSWPALEQQEGKE